MGEAKFCWLNASTIRRDQTSYINTFIEEARKGIRKSRPDSMRRLAIVFVTPYVSKKQNNGLTEKISHIVKQIKALEADAFAWIFPDIEKCVSFKSWLYPGAFLIIKEVKR
jgi:hypothetical protein